MTLCNNGSNHADMRWPLRNIGTKSPVTTVAAAGPMASTGAFCAQTMGDVLIDAPTGDAQSPHVTAALSPLARHAGAPRSSASTRPPAGPIRNARARRYAARSTVRDGPAGCGTAHPPAQDPPRPPPEFLGQQTGVRPSHRQTPPLARHRYYDQSIPNVRDARRVHHGVPPQATGSWPPSSTQAPTAAPGTGTGQD